MIDHQIQVNDLTPQQGIFYNLDLIYSEVLPWINLNINFEQLDRMYKYHSGLKILHYPIAYDITQGQPMNAAIYIWGMFGHKWKTDYNTIFDIEYNPIQNYNMTDTTDINSRNDILSNDKESNYNDRNKKTDVQTERNTKDNNIFESVINENNKEFANSNERKNTNSTSDNKDNSHNLYDENYHGFNSDSDSGVDVNTNTSNQYQDSISVNTTIEDIQSNDLTNKYNNSIRGEVNNGSITENDHETNIENNIDYEIKNRDSNQSNLGSKQISNNIKGLDGRKSAQELLNETLEFAKNKYFEIVFHDIDSLITLPCY